MYKLYWLIIEKTPTIINKIINNLASDYQFLKNWVNNLIALQVPFKESTKP